MAKIYPQSTRLNTALLIIDIINSCAHPNCEHPQLKISFTKVRQMVPKLVNFINEYRKTVNGLIIFTNTTPWQKKYLTENINELYTDPKTTYYSKDNTGFAEDFYLVKPQEGDIIITKNHYDTFATSNLDKTLKAKSIKYLVVTGIFGDGCVLATICGGFSKGYNFIILKDLIETSDTPIRQNLLAKLKAYTWPIMYGKTLESKDFLKAWRQRKTKENKKSPRF